MHFRKSHVHANKLDVQETDFSFTQFTEAEKFSRCRFTHGIQLLIFGIWLQKCFILSQTNTTTPQNKYRENSSRDTTSNKHTQNQTKVPTQHDNFDLSDVDYVLSNAKFSRFGAMLYIFEDNEAVIKMIIKGRSSTMRHVSRTTELLLVGC